MLRLRWNDASTREDLVNDTQIQAREFDSSCFVRCHPDALILRGGRSEVWRREEHYIKLSEVEKNRKLNNLLDGLDFNQVVICVKSVIRAEHLNQLLVEGNFPSTLSCRRKKD
ncbi:hypothetical protein Droror1_Dr00019808 [Drosera rotundifolia]